jgi:hypothetical protein
MLGAYGANAPANIGAATARTFGRRSRLARFAGFLNAGTALLSGTGATGFSQMPVHLELRSRRHPCKRVVNNNHNLPAPILKLDFPGAPGGI